MKTFRHFGIYSWVAYLGLGFCCSAPLYGQNTIKNGLLFNDAEYQKFRLLGLEGSKDGLTEAYSLKHYSPYPRSQGNMASCVGWAVGFGAMTIQKAIKNCVSDRKYITQHLAYSAAFIYNQIKLGSNCQSGASLGDAFMLLKSAGNCLENTFFSLSDCQKTPSRNAFLEAHNFRLEKLPYKVFKINASKQVKIDAVRNQVFNDSPVIVGFTATPPYDRLIAATHWQPEPSPVNRGHAMVVVSYDDHNRTFELMNSYGENWGKGGFIKISYDDFADYARHAYVLPKIGQKGAEAAIPIITETRVALMLSTQVHMMEFEPVALSYIAADNCYKMDSNRLKVDEHLLRFNILLPGGRHLYMINQDTKGKGKILFDHSDQLKDANISFPRNLGIPLANAGDEEICFLFSHEPIRDIDELIKFITDNTGNLSLLLEQYFKRRLLTKEQILYSNDQFGFEAKTSFGQGKIIPLHLRLTINK